MIIPRHTAAWSWRSTAITVVVGFSFGLLGWHLGDRGLWNDEYATVLLISSGNIPKIIAAVAADLHPPLYFLGLHAWTLLAGTSDFALRWLSTALALPAIPLIALVGRRLFGKTAGLIAAACLAFSPAFVEFSRMARYYSLVLSLGLLATALLLKALRRPGWCWWLAYALTGTALIYTFYPSAGLWLAHGALVYSWPGDRGQARRRWLTGVAATAAAFLPILITTASAQVAAAAGGGGPGADLSRSGIGFALGLGASAYTFSVGETLFPWYPLAWAGLAAVAVMLAEAVRHRNNRVFWQCAACTGVCIVFVSLTVTFISVRTPFLNVPARGLFALPFYLLCLAYGFSSLPRGWIQFAVGGILLVVWTASLVNDYRGVQFLNPIYLTPGKEAAARVSQQAHAGDLIISDSDSMVAYYLSGGPAGTARLFTSDMAGIEAAIANRPTWVWLVTLGLDSTEGVSNAGTVRQQLSVDYVLEQTEPMLPIDATYRRYKDLILRRPSYTYRLTIELYRRRAS